MKFIQNEFNKKLDRNTYMTSWRNSSKDQSVKALHTWSLWYNENHWIVSVKSQSSFQTYA